MCLEDIDRIEILRGPGGSLWCGNAFNGVINIMDASLDPRDDVELDLWLRYAAALAPGAFPSGTTPSRLI